jgi:hypothetical protein
MPLRQKRWRVGVHPMLAGFLLPPSVQGPQRLGSSRRQWARRCRPSACAGEAGPTQPAAASRPLQDRVCLRACLQGDAGDGACAQCLDRSGGQEKRMPLVTCALRRAGSSRASKRWNEGGLGSSFLRGGATRGCLGSLTPDDFDRQLANWHFLGPLEKGAPWCVAQWLAEK